MTTGRTAGNCKNKWTFLMRIRSMSSPILIVSLLMSMGMLMSTSVGLCEMFLRWELVRGIPLYTLTTCFRNVIKELPFDLLSARLGDQVIWSLLGAHGKGKYLSDISPAAYRVHDGGVHSKKSQLEKIEMSLLTSNALLSYYSRLKDEPNARYFAEYSFRLSRRLIGWKRLSVLLLQGLFVGFSR
jgi:hypothetical protein